MKESDLFLPLKKYFNNDGFKVYAEVPCFYRCVDFVAVSIDKPDYHIAVEMKTSFTKEVIDQAHTNQVSFHRSFIAVPTKIRRPEENPAFGWCESMGIGILRVLPNGDIKEVLESRYEKPFEVYDFTGFEESKDDIAGIPSQKGVSSAFVVLDRIKDYVTKHPEADWQEIYENVQHHYSSKASLSGCMSFWKGFNLKTFKKLLPLNNKSPKV